MSYRLFGREIDTDASLLVKVFQKKRNLSKKVIPSIIKFCKLNNNEARFFELLFEFTKAKSQDEIKRLFDLMNEVKGVDNISLSLDQYSYYSKWYYSALWALMNVKPNQPASFYAKHLIPPISVSDAKEAIRVLDNIGLIKKNDDGTYNTLNRHITSGKPKKRSAVRNYHKEIIDLAQKSIESVSTDKRDISTVTASVDHACLLDIKEILDETRKKIQSRVESVDQASKVIQINFQVFPTSKEVKA